MCDDGFIEAPYISSSELLIAYCQDYLEKLGKLYYGGYGKVYYEGTLEELPEEVQLIIRLTE